jgi:hypothetical protein
MSKIMSLIAKVLGLPKKEQPIVAPKPVELEELIAPEVGAAPAEEESKPKKKKVVKKNAKKSSL